MLCTRVQAGLREAAGLTLGGKPEPSILVVVLTGMLLVFGILVLLYLILTLEGKIFSGLAAKKLGEAKPPAPAPQAVQPARPYPAAQAGGVPAEVAAAIAAAIAVSSGGAHTLRSVSPARAGHKRGRWGMAGAMQSTEPF